MHVRVPPNERSASLSANASHSTHAAAWSLSQDTWDGGGNVHGEDAGSRQSIAAAAIALARCWVHPVDAAI